MSVDEEGWRRLGGWLAPYLGADDPALIVDQSSPESVGYSAETIIFLAIYFAQGVYSQRRLVLRVESDEPPVYPEQVTGLDAEIDLQRRVMSALAKASDVPVAAILGYESSRAVIGAPFFVMEFVEGSVPPVDPPYTVGGFFAEATPAQRAAMLTDGLRVLAAIHDLDWQQLGVGWLLPPRAAPTLERQLDLWEAFAARELHGRVHPGIDEASARLRRHPPTGSAPALNWGDPRPGNMIWRDFRCVCATDFESAGIGPPEQDLGWWLMFDRASHEVVDAPRLEGEPTRDEQRSIYAGFRGFDVGDTRPFELFAALRYSAIVVRVMNRWADRGLVAEDHTIWLENPASTCLEQLLHE